jgi:hypothetical protein
LTTTAAQNGKGDSKTERGAGLLLAGVAVSLVPHAVTLLAGRRLFPSLHPGVLLGACAGAGVSSAALEALADAAGSKATGSRRQPRQPRPQAADEARAGPGVANALGRAP